MTLKPGLQVMNFLNSAVCTQIGMIVIYLLEEELVLITGGIDNP